MAEYFLQVELIVHENNHREFERLVEAFMSNQGFSRIDPESDKSLVLALRTPEPIAYDGYERRQSQISACRDGRVAACRSHMHKGDGSEPREFFRYVHVWRITDMQDLDLVRLMTLIADDPQYLAINKLVVRETQNFVFRVPWLSTLPELAPIPQFNVIRVTRQLSTRELGTYLFTLGALIPSLEAEGFRTMGYFQNVTGLLNTVTEYWQADGIDEETIKKLVSEPRELTERVFGKTPLADEIRRAHENSPATYAYEVYESYLPATLQNVEHVDRSWGRVMNVAEHTHVKPEELRL